MFEINDTLPKIKIDLDNGVYTFSRESATGKSYLASLLNSLYTVKPVVAHSYIDHCKKSINKGTCENRKVIMFDRYDLYNGEYADLIEKCSKSSIVLIDCKADCKLKECPDYCAIHFTPELIEVFQ